MSNPAEQLARQGRAKPNGAAAHDAQARRLFKRADQLIAKPSPLLWAIRDVFPIESYIGIVGPSGAMKTFVALDMACALATGCEWFGRPTRSGAAFYLGGEGQRGIAKRLRAWSLARDISLEGAPLFVSDRMPAIVADNLAAAMVVHEIDQMRDEHETEPRLVVLDTVARCLHGANESATADMGMLNAAVDMIRHRFGCTVAAIHHTGKSGEPIARGSYAFYAALDCELQVKRADQLITITTSKAKDWQPADPIVLRAVVRELDWLAEGGGRETSIVLEAADPAAEVDALKRDQARAMKAGGKSLREIADHFGVTKSSIERWLK